MTLNITETQRTDGVAGTGGFSGASGTAGNPNGGGGSNGQPGAGVSLGRTGLALLGDAGGDRVVVELQAVGGAGGGGGLGGSGRSATATVTSTSSPGSSLQEAVYGPAGAGGAGGNGGAAGQAQVTYTALDIDLAGGVGVQNSLRLVGTAWGGNGGSANSGGAGGNSGYTGTTTSTSITATSTFTATTSQLGTEGGAAGTGGAGASGATATVRFDDISVVGQNNLVTFFGTANGGSGGGGNGGGRGGSGAAGAAGGSGGDGGNGALGLAEATRLDVQATGGLNLTVYLDARGGQGNQGGQGGNSGIGQTINGSFTNGVGSTLNTQVYAGHGRGGDGGDGGDGVARLADSSITGSSMTDSVLLYLRAAGGLAGTGGGGLPAVASSNTTSGSTTSVVQGIPTGQRGADGIVGTARIEITNTTISLGDGDDRLEFDLLASGPGARVVTVTGNSLNGGIGTDQLRLGTGRLNEPAAVLNLALGVFGFGTGPLSNTITGFEVFDATAAADRFTDGTGNQTYRMGEGNDTLVGGAGNDSADGGAGADSLAGGADNDTLRGGTEADTLAGGQGNDSLLGEAGDDWLIGGVGLDTLAGGAGNDVYVADAADRILELAGGGTDTVQSAGNHVLAAEVEVLQLTGALNANGTGNTLANTIIGNAGANRLNGWVGNDTIFGGGGADTLIGSVGADSLVGGTDNDLYLVDALDRVVELAGGGIDTVQSAVSHTLAAEVEVLELTGALNVNGTGNTAANTIIGNAGNNRLSGWVGNDTLLGGAGHDTLTGGPGRDSLAGGAGNDVYVVDLSDRILELPGGGTDTVQSIVSQTLAAEVEVLEFTGTLDTTGTGNALGNLMLGNAANNRLNGGIGDDTLVGGAGADTLVGGLWADSLVGGAGADAFLFEIPAQAGDIIADFLAADDQVLVRAGTFDGGLVAGMNLAATGRFVANAFGFTTSGVGVGQFVFNTTNGQLRWDADGLGVGSSLLLATFVGMGAGGLTAADITVIA